MDKEQDGEEVKGEVCKYPELAYLLNLERQLGSNSIPHTDLIVDQPFGHPLHQAFIFPLAPANQDYITAVRLVNGALHCRGFFASRSAAMVGGFARRGRRGHLRRLR